MIPTPSPESTALVTGASSGIGVELARELARRGHGLVLVARREERLLELAGELTAAHGVRVEAVACDLADAQARGTLPERVEALGLRVDVLVNNAGLGTVGAFCDQELERELATIRVNCEAVVGLSSVYARQMKARGSGAILTVASSSGFAPLPWYATYAASKACALHFSEALHAELAPAGVSVTALCPGPVKTEFNDDSGMSESFARWLALANVSAEACARQGIHGLAKNKRVVVPGLHVRISGAAGRYVPRAPALALLRRLYPA